MSEGCADINTVKYSQVLRKTQKEISTKFELGECSLNPKASVLLSFCARGGFRTGVETKHLFYSIQFPRHQHQALNDGK